MGGPGSGRHSEGGTGGESKPPEYQHHLVKQAERNRQYKANGMPKGGVQVNSKNAHLFAAAAKKKR